MYDEEWGRKYVFKKERERTHTQSERERENTHTKTKRRETTHTKRERTHILSLTPFLFWPEVVSTTS